MATFTGQAGTNNTFIGSAVADTFLWATADLNNLDTATGGGGADVLRLTTAGGLLVNALAGISGIPTIQLAAGTNTLTLANGNFTGLAGGRMDVLGGTGNDTIDASGLTGANFVLVTSGAGLDVLRGGAGNDLFRFAAVDLSGDTVTGGLGSDRLELSTAGTITAAALAGVSGVENIALAAGTNTITLANANLSGVAGGRINVLGGTGNDTINASGLTGTNAVLTLSGAGLDVLTGGAGGDIFRFAVADLNGDTVSGGLGSDRLELTTAGVLNLAALAGLSGVETIALAAGTNTLTLANGNVSGLTGGRISVLGGTGNDTIDASGLTGANAMLTLSGTGLDVLRGGAGADIFRFAVTELSGDTITGGLGSDRLELSTAGVVNLAALAGLSGVETIVLAAGTNSLALANSNLSGVASGRIDVFAGSGNDTVNASTLTGANFVLVSAGAGLDVLTGGAGNDLFRFNAADLNADTVNGGLGSDRLELATAGVLTQAMLTGLSGVEIIALAAGTNTITLANGNLAGVAGGRVNVLGGTGNDTIDASGLTGTNTLSLVNANYAGIAGGRIDVFGGSGNDTIDASRLSAPNFVLVTAGAGVDVLTGGAGNDLFRFTAADLNGDTVSGGLGNDRLELTAPGTVTAAALAGVSGVELIALANGTNSIALGDANFAGVVSGRITVLGGSGNDTVTALTATSTNAIDVTAGAGNDTLTGSVGSDTFRFAAADLTSADTVQGSGGFADTLQLTTAGVVGSLAGVTGVEQINLASGGNQIDLFDANYAVPLSFGPTIFVNGASGSSIINASNLSASNAIVYSGGGGTDSVTSGSGADRFVYSNGRRFVAGSFLDGGGGTDTISFDRSMDFLGDAILGIEVLQSTSTAGVAVAISRENAAGFTQFAGSSDNGPTDTFTVQLTAGSTTDLSNLTLANRDAADAINVVSLGGADTITKVVLSSSIARFTGGEGRDFVSDRGGVQAIVLGEGDDEVSFQFGNLFAPGDTIDGGGGKTLSFSTARWISLAIPSPMSKHCFIEVFLPMRM